MLPLHDNAPIRRFPAAVWALIFVNFAIFLHELQLSPDQLQLFVYRYGLIPAEVMQPGGLMRYWPTFITCMFLHGGWLHILGNMWFLWIFGDNVEDRLGTIPFLVFYFCGGIAAGILQVVASASSQIPTIGASGAIAAVMAAYLVFYPRARVLTLIPIFIFPWFIELPAVIWIGFWFLEQYLNGVAALTTTLYNMGGVAYWGHVGGFVFGLIAALPWLASPQPPPRYRYRGDYPY